MTITALPSQMQPVTNKRNATLLQTFMSTTELYVEPDRGVVKFVPMPEDNFATNGRTVAGEIEELERGVANDGSGVVHLRPSGISKSKKRMSTKSLRSLKSKYLQPHEEYISSDSLKASPPLPPMPNEPNTLDKRATNAPKLGRRKSFMAAVFGNKTKY